MESVVLEHVQKVPELTFIGASLGLASIMDFLKKNARINMVLNN